MKSFLKELEDKFMELENYCDACDRPADQCVCEEEIDEQNVAGAVAGYNTPTSFAAPGKWKNKNAQYESVNTPPNYSLKDEKYQRPESEEEEFMDKFPFALDDAEWQHKQYEYPSKDLTGTPGTATKHKHMVQEAMERKYEQLIEGYRDFKSGDVQPSKKVKESIREIAKKLQEIETIVNYSTKYKNESGVTSNAYGNGTKNALAKISERLIKISERIRSLGE